MLLDNTVFISYLTSQKKCIQYVSTQIEMVYSKHPLIRNPTGRKNLFEIANVRIIGRRINGCWLYRIASNKSRGVHLIFYIFGGRLFKGGVYTREAFITYNLLQFYISTKRFCHLLLSEKRDYLLHQRSAYCRYTHFDMRYEDIICKPTPIPVLVQIVEEE